MLRENKIITTAQTRNTMSIPLRRIPGKRDVDFNNISLFFFKPNASHQQWAFVSLLKPFPNRITYKSKKINFFYRQQSRSRGLPRNRKKNKTRLLDPGFPIYTSRNHLRDHEHLMYHHNTLWADIKRDLGKGHLLSILFPGYGSTSRTIARDPMSYSVTLSMRWLTPCFKVMLTVSGWSGIPRLTLFSWMSLSLSQALTPSSV